MKNLNNLSRWFGRFPSIAYAIIYLSLIPTFALIYSFLPYHFYHATVQYEADYSHQREVILGELENEITSIANKPNESNVGKLSKLRKAAIIDLSSLKVTGGEVSFHLFAAISYVGGNEFYDMFINGKVSFHISMEYLPIMDTHAYGADKELTIENLSVTASLSDFPTLTPEDKIDIARQIFPFNYKKSETDKVIMHISPGLERKIINLTEASAGFPSSISGNFVRMFYLSAITITTVGYGDILPLTTTARLLVSIEAILGIVVIGLFLNSLTFRREHDSRIAKNETYAGVSDHNKTDISHNNESHIETRTSTATKIAGVKMRTALLAATIVIGMIKIFRGQLNKK